MKKVGSLILIAMMLFGSLAFAADQSLPLDLYITIEEAKTLALAHNIDLQNKDLEITIAERELIDAKADAKDQKWEHSNSDELNALIMTRDYTPYIGQYTLDNLKREKTNLQASVEVSVTKAYLNHQQLSEALKTDLSSLDEATKSYESKKKEKALGLITETDLQGFELTKLRAELAVQNSQRDLEMDRVSFNQLIGYPVDTAISLASKIDIKTTMDYNITLLTNNIEKSSLAVIKAKEALVQREYKFKLMDENIIQKTVTVNGVSQNPYGTPTGYTDTKNKIEEDRLEIEKIKRSEVINLRMKFNTLRSQELTNKINNLTYQATLRTYEANQLKSKLGLITKNILDASFNATQTALRAYNKSQSDFYIADLEFKEMIKTTHVNLLEQK